MKVKNPDHRYFDLYLCLQRMLETSKMTDYGDWDKISFDNAYEFIKEFRVAYENFWQKKQLGIDKNGKKYRTDVKRTRPKPLNEFDLEGRIQ